MTGHARHSDARPRTWDGFSESYGRDHPPRFRDAEPWRHQRTQRPCRSFGSLLGFTTLGALLPGSGLVAAGRRSGWLIVVPLLTALAALAALVLTGAAEPLVVSLAVRPNALRLLSFGLVAAGVAWSVIIVVSHMALREGRLNIVQQLVSAVLVCALVGLAVASTGFAARSGLAQSGLVKNLFQGGAEQQLAAGAPRVNVLLIGSDAGSGRVGVRPDTLITASIDTRTGDVVLLSLPRNLQNVPFPVGTPMTRLYPQGFNCGNECLINAVWQKAEENRSLFPGDPNPGLTATRHAVSGALGLRIDYYAMVNLSGFEDVIDAMGGLTLAVPRDLPIGGGTDAITGEKNPITGYVRAGTRKLNGADALWYARSREGSDDYDRMGRQRCLLGAVVDQAEPRKLVMAFPKLAAAAERNVETDIARAELNTWANLAMVVKDRGQVRSLAFTDKVITAADPDYRAMHALVQNALLPPDQQTSPGATKAPTAGAKSPTVSRPPSAVTVRVLNGTATSGLAARAAAALKAQGFRIAEVANAGRSAPRTLVQHDPGFDESGRTLATAVPGSVATPVAGLGGTVTLIVGADYTGVAPVRVQSAPSPSTTVGTPQTISTPQASKSKDPTEACA